MPHSDRPKALQRSEVRYAAAVLITGAALGLQFVLEPVVEEIAFLLFYPAVFLSSWIGGLGPGLLSTALSGIAVSLFFFPPAEVLIPLQYAIRLAVFLGMGVLFSFLNGLLRTRNSLLARSLAEVERSKAVLKSSENEFRTFFELSGNGVEQVDPETKRFIRVNRRMCEMTGYSQEELLQRTFMEVTHPDDRQCELEAYEKVLQGSENTWSVEKRYIRKEGSILWVVVTGTVVRDYEGKPLYSISTIHDVSDRKKAEDKLRYQTGLLKTITDNATSGLLMMDEKGHPTFLNPAGEKVMGYKLEEIRDKPMHYFVHHKKPDGSFYPMEECPIDNGQAELTSLQDQEEVFVHKDGHLYPIRFSVAPLEHEGKPVGAVVEFRDITSEKELLQNLAALVRKAEFERARFETAMSQIPAAVIIGEAPSGKLIFGNDRVDEVWGWPLIYSQDVQEYREWKGFHLDGRPYEAHEWPLARAITAGENVEGEDCIVPRSDGTRAIVRLSAAPVRDKEGKIIAGVVICQDITELADAIRVRDEFLTIASHELKTPITSLKLQLQMVRREIKLDEGKLPSAEKLAKSLEVSLIQSDRLTRLVENLLNVSRIGGGKLQIEREELDLAELVSAVADHHREQFESAGSRITVSVRHPVPLCVDRFRMEQVITNLLSNAAKYGAGKPVNVIVDRVDGKGIVKFQDFGLGIAKEHHQRIFERFERAISANNISGLGVGLYIAREIVAAHGGQIFVESTPGEGSTFTVEIPLAQSQSADQSERLPARLGSVNEGTR